MVYASESTYQVEFNHHAYTLPGSRRHQPGKSRFYT